MSSLSTYIHDNLNSLPKKKKKKNPTQTLAPFIILLYYQIHSGRKLKQVTSQLTSSVVAETKNSCSDIFVSLRILTCSLACKIIKTWSSSCVCIYVCVCGPPCVHECMCVCCVVLQWVCVVCLMGTQYDLILFFRFYLHIHFCRSHNMQSTYPCGRDTALQQ